MENIELEIIINDIVINLYLHLDLGMNYYYYYLNYY
jgi:hypothetical protein